MTWRHTRLKHLAELPIRNGLGEAGAFDDPAWPRYVRTTDIAGPRKLRDDVFASLPPVVASKAMLAAGDILMTTAGATIGKSTTFTEGYPACYAGFLARFRPGEAVDGRFIAYWMQSTVYWDQINAGAVRSTIENFSASKYQNLHIAVPSLDVQRRIADFLDDQVTLLDQAIALRQQQIALLDERMEALRDSVIDELDAPRVALRYLTDFFKDGDWIESPYIVDDGIRLIQTGNIGVGHYKDQGFRYVTQQTFDDLGCTEVLPGDVLVSRLSPPVGRAALAPDSGERMIVSVDVAIVRSLSVRHDYLVQAMSTRRHLATVDIASRGATMARVSRSQLGSFKVPVPDVSRQRATATLLVTRQAEHMRTRALLDEFVRLIREKKHALITAAVTGKFDVTTARSVA